MPVATYSGSVPPRPSADGRRSPPPSEKVTRANGRASRAAILAAAVEVFAERGYAGTTMAEIARRVRLTQPALLHHFRSKDELLLAVIRTRDETADYLLEDLARVDVMARLIADNLANPMICLLFTTLGAEAVREDHPAHEYFVERYRRTVGLMAEQLERVGVGPGDASLLAREAVAGLDAIHQQWLLDPQEVDLERSLRFFERRLRATIRDLAGDHGTRRPDQLNGSGRSASH